MEERGGADGFGTKQKENNLDFHDRRDSGKEVEGKRVRLCKEKDEYLIKLVKTWNSEMEREKRACGGKKKKRNNSCSRVHT